MTYGYSEDLRKKALAYYDKCRKQVLVCEVFGIHRNTLRSWIKLREQGDISRRPNAKKRASYKICHDKLVSYIEKNPDAYLHEIGKEFNVSDVAVLYACRRYGITRKKNGTL